MKIKISTKNEKNINRIGDYDCSTGFTRLKKAVNTVNMYGDPHETYTLNIIADADDSGVVRSSLSFKRNMKLELQNDNHRILVLKGTVTVEPNVQVEFFRIRPENLEVDKVRISEPDFVPLITVQRANKLSIGTPPQNDPNATTSAPTSNSTSTTTTSTSASAPAHVSVPNGIDELVRTAPHGTIFVKTDGNDRDDGLTPEGAKRTIHAAINTAPINGTVIVYPGSYDENITINKPLKLEGVDVLLNGRQKGSCITCMEDHNITIKGFTIINGKNEKGGGIHNTANLTLENCKIMNNKATNGGGIYNNRKLTVNNSKILLNKAIYGGGIYNQSDLALNMCKVRFNRTEKDGGGLYTTKWLEIDSSVFHGNSAGYGFFGGAIFNAESSGIQMIGPLRFIKNNSTNGGAIYNASKGYIFADEIIDFSSNESCSLGGAIYNEGQILLKGINASGNKSMTGSVIYNVNSGQILDNKDGSEHAYKFFGNSAVCEGAVFFNEGEIDIPNPLYNNNYPSEPKD